MSGLGLRIQRSDEQLSQHALVTAVLGLGWFSNEAVVDPDDPAGEDVGRKIAANHAGCTGSLDATHEHVSEFGPPQLGAFRGVIGGTEGLVLFHQ